jgi:hypothetical protein
LIEFSNKVLLVHDEAEFCTALAILLFFFSILQFSTLISSKHVETFLLYCHRHKAQDLPFFKSFILVLQED